MEKNLSAKGLFYGKSIQKEDVGAYMMFKIGDKVKLRFSDEDFPSDDKFVIDSIPDKNTADDFMKDVDYGVTSLNNPPEGFWVKESELTLIVKKENPTYGYLIEKMKCLQ